jgi:hypothetical protein
MGYGGTILIPRSPHGDENIIVRKIFGSKLEEATRGQRNLQNEEIHNSYSSSCIIRVINSRRCWPVEMRNEHSILIGNSEGKR